ncbi:family 16 glycosylhydrolase [Microvirga aerilata]|uniref:family 16 glycosylhydrolase n=1 Tax=Microvirga aerilata TaxID=670292 RepID=UPI0036377378
MEWHRGSHQHQTIAINKGIDLSQSFHTYGTMWTASTISFYLDGVQVHSMATPLAQLSRCTSWQDSR